MRMFKLLPMAGGAALVASLLASCGPYYAPEPYGPPSERLPRQAPQDHEATEYQGIQDREYPSGPYSQDPAPAPSSSSSSSSSGGYPTAERTSNPDQVISPYAPYNVIDVAGFRSGQLARDPSNQKIFRVP
ncbi:MAG: hypothetical protein QM680_07930 [Luteolibacter sp.]